MSHDPFEERDGTCVNPSTAPAIADIIDARLSRRTLLKGIGAGTAFGLFGCATLAATERADGSAPLTFSEVGRAVDDKHHVAAGYNAQVLIAQGDPIRPGAPPYRPGQQTGADQEQQFGTDNDFVAYMPLPRGVELVDARPARRESREPPCNAVFPGREESRRPDARAVRSPDGGPGLLDRRDREARQPLARRHRQPVQPAHLRQRRDADLRSGSSSCPRMQTPSDPTGTRVFGTFNNCAGGTTPWGTILTAEENIQNYFAGNAAQGAEAAARKRYNITGRGVRYEAWGRYFDRFNSTRSPTSRTASAGSSKSIPTIRSRCR